MIHEVDEGLRLLLVDAGLQDSGVELVFDAPTKDWSARRNAPTVSVFLYGIREDAARRRSGTAEEYDGEGVVTGRRAPARWFELTYLVTAWTNRPQDEHRLLSEVLRCLIRTSALPERMLTGSLAELGLTVEMEAASAGSGDRPSTVDVWSALGGELKAAIDLRVWAPLSGELEPVGPPVTEGLVVRTAAAVDGEATDPGRRLRYENGAPDRRGEGFAAERERQLPPGRRRRGGGSGSGSGLR
ncbi:MULTISPECIES: DUF4255 domain-containing protein [unclassified Streptomyces]|uniref:DUF4255 domain-containing protein n=1 Tax=unclassified Streptomyces TaxID=2593676 RepID=UPI000DAC07D1|nr:MULTISPECIES: DUF4255 domain-containing protein [unclassified Streptomyces]PZT75883.1 DUF4255 domain-containing protein [Streptomyces sp. AC1-42W]PZT80164.1 DUF4255 domain-containing protein [Streptomyces sp. AC1-42T]